MRFRFAEFDHPGDAGLRDIWASARGMSRERMIETFVGRIFADISPRAALPKLKETIGAWKPDRIVRESMEFAVPSPLLRWASQLPVSGLPTLKPKRS